MLKSRIYKPSMNEGLMIRPRLLENLKKNSWKPIVTVIAPAGYGKSVLVSQWLDELKLKYSWVSLQKDCNDVRNFLCYLGESMRSNLPSGKSEVLAMSEARDLPGVKEVEYILLQDIDRLEQKHVFVFDDYHLIENHVIHDLINDMIRNLPERHKLVLLSRFDLPLNLRRVKAYDQVNEIGMMEMRFSPDEIQDLSLKVFSINMEKGVARSVFEKTEGWIIPIRLIMKGSTNGKSPAEFLQKNKLKIEEIVIFLLEETLNLENSMIKDALMSASLFEEFNVELLARIAASENPEIKKEKMLLHNEIKKFISRSLFIISLDDENEMYRFHHMVQDFLKTRFKEYVPENRKIKILEIGSRFLEELGYHTEAIKLNVRYGFYSSAVAIIERYRHSYLNMNRFDVLEEWHGLMPSKIIEENAGLLLIRIYLSELSTNIESMKSNMRRLEILLTRSKEESESSMGYWGEYLAISSLLSLLKEDYSEALDKMTQVSDLIGKKYFYVHGFSKCFGIVAMISTGKESEARSMLEKERAELELTDSILRSQNHIAACFIEFFSAKLDALYDHAQAARKIALADENQTVFVLSDYYITFSNYMMNNVEKNDFYLDEAVRYRFITRPGWIIHLLYLKSLYLLAECRNDEMIANLDNMDRYNENLTLHDFSNDILIMKCELYQIKGDFQKAWELGESAVFCRKSVTHRYFYPKLTEVKLLLSRDNASELEKANKLLLDYEREAKKSYNRMKLLQVMCLRSIVLARLGDESEALKLLKSILKQTKEGKIIRLYTDLGTAMLDLLQKLDDVSKHDPHLSEVIKSFDRKNEIERKKQEKDRLEALVQSFRGLSAIELRILTLISEGLRNKEISNLMHYSLGTIKTYVYNIYKKIEAKNRTKAILLFKEFERIEQSELQLTQKHK